MSDSWLKLIVSAFIQLEPVYRQYG